MSSREDKLKQLQAKQAAMTIVTDGQPLIEQLSAKIDELKQLFGAGVNINVDDLVDEVAKINSIAPSVHALQDAINNIEIPELLETVQIRGLDGIIPAVDDLKETVRDFHFPEIPDQVRVTGLEGVQAAIDQLPSSIQLSGLEGLERVVKAISEHVKYLKQLKDYKVPDVKVQVEIVDNQKISEVTKRLDALIKAVADNSPQTIGNGRDAGDFVPTRRVRLVGNRLMFDDDYWGSSTAGGGSNIPTVVSSGVTAVPVVNPDGTTISAGGGGGGGSVTQGTSPWVVSGTVTASAQPGVDIGDVTINNASGASAVNVQDGGNSLTVDYATTGAGTATGALRVELPTNGTGVIATVGAVTAITNALPAGANAIGKLAANSGVDIGDVDVTSAVITGGGVAHDGVGTGVNPLLTGGYASAAAPADVSADGDSVRAWHLRNGAQATVLTAAGALVGGDAANGLDVDVTRLSALVAGSAIIGKVGVDQTTPGTTNAISLAQLGANTVSTGNGTSGTGTLRVSVASDSTGQIALATGSNTIGALTANQSVNVAQINGVTTTMNNGVAGTGVQRITLASDSTGNIATIGTSVTPGGGAANLGKAEDAAHTTGDTGVMMLAVRESTVTDLSAGATNGDYEPLQVDANGALWATLATLIAGEDLTNNVLKVETRATYTNLSADTLVKSGAGRFFGFSVNSTTAGSIKVWDNTAGSGTVLLNTITPTLGFYALPVAVNFTTGLYADVTSTIDLTFFWM